MPQLIHCDHLLIAWRSKDSKLGLLTSYEDTTFRTPHYDPALDPGWLSDACFDDSTHDSPPEHSSIPPATKRTIAAAPHVASSAPPTIQRSIPSASAVTASSSVSAIAVKETPTAKRAAARGLPVGLPKRKKAKSESTKSKTPAHVAEMSVRTVKVEEAEVTVKVEKARAIDNSIHRLYKEP